MFLALAAYGKLSGYFKVVASVFSIGTVLKNETSYNATTWAEWTKSSGVVGDASGLEFTADGSATKTANLPNTGFKPSTKYGILYYVVNNTVSAGGFGFDANVFNYATLTQTVGNNKKVLTSNASIPTNRCYLYTQVPTEPNGNKIKIKDIRIFELPPNSEIEADFTNATTQPQIDALCAKYPWFSGSVNAIQGNMPYTLSGNTVPNIVANGNFANGIAGWTGATLSVVGGLCVYTPTAQYQGAKRDILNFAQYKGHKLYFAADLKTDVTNNYLLLNDGIDQTLVSHVGDNVLRRLSDIRTIDVNAIQLYVKIQDFRTSGWTQTQCDNFVVIDLTAMFGAGNEPNKATCDKMFPSYIDGTQSVGDVTVTSTGKNILPLAVGSGTLNGLTISSDGNEITINGTASNIVYLKLSNVFELSGSRLAAWLNELALKNTSNSITYSLTQISGTPTTGTDPNFALRGKLTDTGLASFNLNTKKATIAMTQDIAYVYFYIVAGVTFSNFKAKIQIEHGSVQTTHEPYISNTQTITAIGNRVGSVYDTIDNAGVRTKRCDVKTLVAGDISSLTTTFTNVDTVGILKPVNDINYNNSVWRGGSTTIDNMTILPTATALDNVSNVWSIFPNQSNSAYYLVVPKGTYANLATAQTALAGKKIIYQLATPIVTDAEKVLQASDVVSVVQQTTNAYTTIAKPTNYIGYGTTQEPAALHSKISLEGFISTNVTDDGATYEISTQNTPTLFVLSLPLGTTLQQAKDLINGKRLYYKLATGITPTPKPITTYPNGTIFVDSLTGVLPETKYQVQIP